MDNEELDKKYKKNTFKVPDGYFETFDDRVFEHLRKKEKKHFVLHKWQKWSIAASVFIVASVAVFLYKSNTKEVVDLAVADVSSVELENFHSEAEVSDDEFMEMLSNQAVDSIYQLEVISVRNNSGDKAIERMDEEYSPLDEIEI